jgi:hypothetical protein
VLTDFDRQLSREVGRETGRDAFRERFQGASGRRLRSASAGEVGSILYLANEYVVIHRKTSLRSRGVPRR